MTSDQFRNSYEKYNQKINSITPIGNTITCRELGKTWTTGYIKPIS
jgi:hypothetical protein